jgi:hypothetical protein
MRPSPSIVPADRLDRDIYLVLEDFGARAGCAWRDTDEADTDLETVVQNLLSGQFAYPLRIVSFNPVEGWSRDATSDVADALAQRVADTDAEICTASLHRRQRHKALRHAACAALTRDRLMPSKEKPMAVGATTMTCVNCDDLGWVCENHRTAPGTVHAPAPVAALAHPARPATLLAKAKCRGCRKDFRWRSTRTAGDIEWTMHSSPIYICQTVASS